MSSERPAWAPAPIVAIVGWKKSGKTTTVERLVDILTRRGFNVATVKHAHHNFDIDHESSDSARHRAAGARQVAIVSRKRSAIMREHADGPEPSLQEIVARLEPCDLIIAEGYKQADVPKIELRRREAASDKSIADTQDNVIAIAADYPVQDDRLPVLDLNAPEAIARFILETFFKDRAKGGPDARPALHET